MTMSKGGSGPTHLEALNGHIRPFDKMERAFEELFHEEFVFKRTDGSKLDKEALRQILSFFLSIGTKAKVRDFVSLDGAHFEARVHFENSIANVVSHSRGKVKDGKVIWLEACTDVRRAYGQLEHAFDIARMIQNMTWFIKILM